MPSHRVAELLLSKFGLLASSLGAGALEHAVRTRTRALSLRNELEYELILRSNELEQQHLIEEIVVSESWFFREPSALELLVERLTQEARTGVPLRVLCIPCANGEEPYSVAMMLLEAGVAAEQIEVHGVDISEAALSRARAARYSRMSVRSELGVYQRYFRSEGERLVLAPRVVERVQFKHGNVLAQQLYPARSFQAVLCRNLLIYLDKGSRTAALRNIAGMLRPNGLLFVGHSEANDVAAQGYTRAGDARHFAFTLSPESRSATMLPSRNSQLAAARPSSLPTERPPLGTVVPRRARLSLAGGSRLSITRPSVPRAGLLPRASWRNRGAVLSARALADQGSLGEAKVACGRALQEFPDSAEALVLMGVVERALGNLESARDSFERALSFAPNHQEALIHLALLAEASGDQEAARRYRARAASAQDTEP